MDLYEEAYSKLDFEFVSKIPPCLAKLCCLSAKSMKQSAQTMLLAFITMFSVAIGHGQLKVNSQWIENVQIWCIISMRTGRGKSTIHQFVNRIMQRVLKKVVMPAKRPGSDIIMPSCTWEKFGEIMAMNGGRIYSLNDEMASFFSTCGIFMQTKGVNNQPTNQADFLSLFNGGSKRRETVAGNSNFNMEDSHLTILGFMQPQAASGLIKDPTSIFVGFANRFLWYFPRPLYSKFQELEIEEEHERDLNEIIENLVDILADLYQKGDQKCTYEPKKILKVTPAPMLFELTNGAKQLFKGVYNDFEQLSQDKANCCLEEGLYSRGKSQVLRMACITEVMTSQMEKFGQQDPVESTIDELLNTVSASEFNADLDEIIDDAEINPIMVGENSMSLAMILVKSSLNQIVTLFGETDNQARDKSTDPKRLEQALAVTLRTPGKIISSSVMIKRNRLRAYKGEMTTGAFTNKVFESLETLDFGRIITTLSNNNSTKTYFQKVDVNDNVTMTEKLAELGISKEEYQGDLLKENEESKKHLSCFQSSKKRRLNPVG